MRTEDAVDLARIMTTRGLTLAVAESLTSGHLQSEIGAISGASEFFQGGITAYSLEQKVKLLRVQRKHAESVNCVSPTVALEMSRGICQALQTDIGIGTTGYAEPNPAMNVQTPHAYFAIWHAAAEAGDGRCVREGFVDGKNTQRVAMQKKVTVAAIDALLDYLRELDR